MKKSKTIIFFTVSVILISFILVFAFLLLSEDIGNGSQALGQDLEPVTPKFRTAVYAFLYTLPGIVICILLFITLNETGKRKKLEEKLNTLAITDALTGQRNGRFLDTVIDTEIHRAERYQRQLSLMRFSIDHFETINETWGQVTGDEVLIQAAGVVQKYLRRSDVFVRLGGEEFVVLLTETDMTGAYEAAEKTRKAIAGSRHPAAGMITASFGVAERLSGETYADLYRRAGQAMYIAQYSGENRVLSFSSIEKYPFASIYLSWDKQWNSGHIALDHQHMKLMEMSNTIVSMALSNVEYKKIAKKVDLLMQHIVEHFGFEQMLFKNIDYLESEEHKATHDELLEKASRYKRLCDTGSANPVVFYTYLAHEVILGHMLKEDVKFYPYIKRKIGI